MSRPISTAMMAITTSNSIRVKPCKRRERDGDIDDPFRAAKGSREPTGRNNRGSSEKIVPEILCFTTTFSGEDQQIWQSGRRGPRVRIPLAADHETAGEPIGSPLQLSRGQVAASMDGRRG